MEVITQNELEEIKALEKDYKSLQKEYIKKLKKLADKSLIANSIESGNLTIEVRHKMIHAIDWKKEFCEFDFQEYKKIFCENLPEKVVRLIKIVEKDVS